MSELMTNAVANREDFHWRLLTTVSALALASCIAVHDAQAANDADRPTVWIELGAQLSHIDGTGEPFAPGFAQGTPASGVFSPISPIEAQKHARYGIGGEGRVTFAPENTNWDFAVGITYGRSNGGKHVQNQQEALDVHKFFKPPLFPSSVAYSSTYPAVLRNFAETSAKNSESHLIVDFMAGKDVGLGMFGRGGLSVVSAGVRFAQFTARSSVNMKARPDLSFYNQVEIFAPSLAPYAYLPTARFHAYTAFGSAVRSFHGIGPSISWEGSAPVAGNVDSAELTFDWGLNAALLFGRQKAQVSHQTTARNFAGFAYTTPTPQHGGHTTRRSVVVPNVGGFAGLSVKFPNSKVSFGYRGDVFFGAMDVGIDAARREKVSFHGPYAKISVGFD